MTDGRVPKETDGKQRWDLLPWPALDKVADVMTFGYKKYSDRGYVGMGVVKLFAAAGRHLTQWYLGEDNDDESSLPHLAHAAANCLMALELLLTDEGVDDRPFKNYTRKG